MMGAIYQNIVKLGLKVIYTVPLLAFSHLKLENSKFQLRLLDPLLAWSSVAHKTSHRSSPSSQRVSKWAILLTSLSYVGGAD
jgi:hypothetical protein